MNLVEQGQSVLDIRIIRLFKSLLTPERVKNLSVSKYTREHLESMLELLKRKESRTLLILGTGWCNEKVLESQGFVKEGEVSFYELGIMLRSGTGHSNKILIGKWGDENVVISQGRVHLNQVWDKPDYLRIWMSVLLTLMGDGRRVISTSSTGGLGNTKVDTLTLDRDVISADIPQPYLHPDSGEYITSWECLDVDSKYLFYRSQCLEAFKQAAIAGNFEYEMNTVRRFIPGPGFGGPSERKLWAEFFKANVVSMSGDPELRLISVWNSLVASDLKKYVALVSYVTDAVDKADHLEIQQRALGRAPDFGMVITSFLKVKW